MFWRYASSEEPAPERHVLLVNNAEVVPSVCNACSGALVFSPRGDSILIARPSAPGGDIHYYCAKCGARRRLPTLSGRALGRYSTDWAIPLRPSPRERLPAQ
jgi:hypothetical protein